VVAGVAISSARVLERRSRLDLIWASRAEEVHWRDWMRAWLAWCVATA